MKIETNLNDDYRRGYQFASDNCAGMCSVALDAQVAANDGFASGYGNDLWTRQACDAIRDLFETDCEVFFVFSGTAANSLALASLCQSYHSVVCHEVAHIETDECGAPEFFSNGTKLLLGGGEDGKLAVEKVEAIITKRADIHFPKPRVLSLTQATELGTVYSVDEISRLTEVALRHGLKVHMDGARFANALASLGLPAKEITWQLGVDVICLGGAKNGLGIGDAVVFFKKELAKEFDYRCKQAGQLCSKMRFISAPWKVMLNSGEWQRNGQYANSMASLLAAQLQGLTGVEIVRAPQANSVFINFSQSILSRLKDRGWQFYTFIGEGSARLMCSWQTTEKDIEVFVADVCLLSQQLCEEGETSSRL